MAGSDSFKFITYYLPHYTEATASDTIIGAYGPRLLSWKGTNQLDNIVRLLTAKPYSRQAVIQLFDATDLSHKDPNMPCTCTLQFLVRSGALHLITHMRSNDAYVGLPHDFFCFTMVQEVLSRILKIELGSYKHFVGSLHLYEDNRDDATRFIGEGYQSTDDSMPKMPEGDPLPSIAALLDIEQDLRAGKKIADSKTTSLEPYWSDLAFMLMAFRYKKDRQLDGIREARRRIKCDVYYPFLDKLESLMNKPEGGTHS